VILPKLFRRLADCLVLNDGDPSLVGFPDYLEQRDDRLFILSNVQPAGFDTVVDVTNGSDRHRRTSPRQLQPAQRTWPTARHQHRPAPHRGSG
jgi:hypothetical protein